MATTAYTAAQVAEVVAEKPQKLTDPQRKALTRYANAGDRGTAWFGAVDRRLKTKGLIEYVGGYRSHIEHRITEKGLRALGLSAPPIPGPEAAVDALNLDPKGEDTGDAPGFAIPAPAEHAPATYRCTACTQEVPVLGQPEHNDAHHATPVPGAETPAGTPNPVIAAEDTGDAPGTDQCPACKGRFPVDTDGAFTTHGMAYDSSPCVTTDTSTPRALVDDVLEAAELTATTTDLPDSARRRLALTRWFIAHPEVPTPHSERHSQRTGVLLHYLYTGVDQLTALYRALNVETDRDAVTWGPDDMNKLTIDGWAGPWYVCVVVDTSGREDDFIARLSASEDPRRFLDIVSTCHHRADDEG